MGIQFKQTIKTFVVLFGVLVFGVLLGVSLVGYIPTNESSPDAQLSSVGAAQEVRETIRVDLTIDYGNGDMQAFSQEKFEHGSTVLDLLMGLGEKGISIETREFPGLGKFIEAIHGAHNTSTSYWQFWVNDEYSKVGAGQYVLEDGDDVLWKRTSERE